MKKFWDKYWVYIVIVIVGLIVSLPLCREGMIGGHDMAFHVFRARGTMNAIEDGQLIPQVDPNVLDGVGHSWNIFYGPLSTYIVAVFKLVTPSWVVAINLFMVLTVILSGVFLYKFAYEVTGKKVLALVAGIIYMTAPYHLADIYIRQAHGELLPFVFIPLVFLGLYRLVKARQGAVRDIAIGVAGIILSHNVSIIIVGVFALIYMVMNREKFLEKDVLKKLLLAGMIALGISAFFWMPMVEAKMSGIYNVFDSEFMTSAMGVNSGSILGNTVLPHRLLVDNWTIDGRMQYRLGLATILGLILLIVNRQRIPKKLREDLKQMAIIGGITVGLAVIPVWALMPQILLSVQFLWRFLMISTMFLSILAGAGFYYGFEAKIKNRRGRIILLVAVTVLAILSSLNILIHGATTDIGWGGNYDYSYESKIGMGVSRAEYLPISMYNNPENSNIPYVIVDENLKTKLREPVVLEGDIRLSRYSKDGSRMRVEIENSGNGKIELPVVYYAGYKAESINENGERLRLRTSVSDGGFLQVELTDEMRSGTIETYYGMSGATVAGVIISIGTVAMCGVGLALRRENSLSR